MYIIAYKLQMFYFYETAAYKGTNICIQSYNFPGLLVEYIINMRLVSWHGSVSLVSCQADTVTDFTSSSSRIQTLCCHNLSEPAATRKIKTVQLLSRTVCTSTFLTTICACSLMRVNPAVNDLTFTKSQKAV